MKIKVYNIYRRNIQLINQILLNIVMNQKLLDIATYVRITTYVLHNVMIVTSIMFVMSVIIVSFQSNYIKQNHAMLVQMTKNQ